MELREPIETINEQLAKEFGRHTDGRVNFRVVFSDDQFEKRWTDKTDDGFDLINPEVRELPKYKQWAPGRYILERLVPVQDGSDLTTKTSYEPAWIFQDRNRNYLPPFFEGCKYVIDSMFHQIGRSGHAKYKDPNVTPEAKAAELQKMQDELFGNETAVGDALAYGSGVSLSGPEFKDTQEQIKQAESKIELSKLVH